MFSTIACSRPLLGYDNIFRIEKQVFQEKKCCWIQQVDSHYTSCEVTPSLVTRNNASRPNTQHVCHHSLFSFYQKIKRMNYLIAAGDYNVTLFETQENNGCSFFFSSQKPPIGWVLSAHYSCWRKMIRLETAVNLNLMVCGFIQPLNWYDLPVCARNRVLHTVDRELRSVWV